MDYRIIIENDKITKPTEYNGKVGKRLEPSNLSNIKTIAGYEVAKNISKNVISGAIGSYTMRTRDKTKEAQIKRIQDGIGIATTIGTAAIIGNIPGAVVATAGIAINAFFEYDKRQFELREQNYETRVRSTLMGNISSGGGY